MRHVFYQWITVRFLSDPLKRLPACSHSSSADVTVMMESDWLIARTEAGAVRTVSSTSMKQEVLNEPR